MKKNVATERAKALSIAFPTYSILLRHKKRLESELGKLGKMRSSEPVSQIWTHLNEMKEFLELYEKLDELNKATILGNA
ncbi:MAG TPA: hypothetical protein PKX57_10490 [Mesotoga sp.]|nr:hypothetical protein [Mesotoga sp.]